MYPPGQDQPAGNVGVGHYIEHKLLPGYLMRVKAVSQCEVDSSRPKPHNRYNITDPEGNDDWLCGYDVRKVG